MSFSEQLNAYKNEKKISQKQLCTILYEVPHRTLQSWLQAEKEPPIYVQELIFFRLNAYKK